MGKTMKAIEFQENDSASQLYWCSEGGGAGGKYYPADQVEALIKAAKKMPRDWNLEPLTGKAIPLKAPEELDKALKVFGV